MKLVTIARGADSAAGCRVGEFVLDFGLAAQVFPELADTPATLERVLDERAGGLDAARRAYDRAANASDKERKALLSSGALAPAASVTLRAPLAPRTLLSHGQAYHGHVRELRPDAKLEKPPHPPSGFLKAPSSVVGSGEAIILPPKAPNRVDYEGEFCVVFGRDCFAASAENAMDYVAGYTIINDVSARDWLPAMRAPETGMQSAYHALNLLYKDFPTFCPMGPHVVTKDEIADYHALKLVTRLNGEIMQEASLSELIWDIPELIAHYSSIFRFKPGDVMSTGTPGGVGIARNPPVLMKPGDRISVTVDGVGTLENVVAAA